jgi:N-acetylmuramoyl-L-alanine amidase
MKIGFMKRMVFTICVTLSILTGLTAVSILVFVLISQRSEPKEAEASSEQPIQQTEFDDKERMTTPTGNDSPESEIIDEALSKTENEEDNSDEDSISSEEDKSATVAWIGADTVNLRAEPDTDSDILEVLRYGQEIVVIDEMGDWRRVAANDIDGYVFAEYISAERVERAVNPLQPFIPVYNQANGIYTVAIDAGHQQKGNNELEPIGPGATEKKAKVAGGTSGVASKVPEYQLTLDVSLELRDERVARGYNVFMVRETNDVNISNSERAIMATEAGADILVRIHANGSADSSASGVLALCPSSRNPYISHLYSDSRALADSILTATVEATGAHRRGVSEVDNMTGINWATMPVTIIEMGFMTNPKEDRLMQTAEYQQLLAKGMAEGIERYFSR